MHPLLNLAYHAGDVLGGAACVVGKLAYFVSDDGKASPRFACPCSFDRSIECKQIGLIGDILDRADDQADLIGMVAKAGYALCNFLYGVGHRTYPLYRIENSRTTQVRRFRSCFRNCDCFRDIFGNVTDAD